MNHQLKQTLRFSLESHGLFVGHDELLLFRLAYKWGTMLRFSRR